MYSQICTIKKAKFMTCWQPSIAAHAAALDVPNAALEAKRRRKHKLASAAQTPAPTDHQENLNPLARLAENPEDPHRDPVQIPPILGKMDVLFNT